MKGTLVIRNLVLRLRLGALASEKPVTREVPVDLTWRGTVEGGISVDYSAVCGILESLAGSDFDYVEDLALEIHRRLSGEFPSGSWEVTVTKPWPPTDLKIRSVSFTVEDGDGH